MEKLTLKTGFDNSIDPDANSDLELKLQMTSLITVFMENAIKTAETYTLHSNRKVITSKDISISLKRELFTFLNNSDIEQKALEIYKEFKREKEKKNEIENTEEKNTEEENTEEEYDEEEYDEEDEYEEEDEEDEEEEEFCISNCSCNICVECNLYNEKWATWKPTNHIETILYDGINKIDKEFNLL